MEYRLPRHLSALARNDMLLSHIKHNLYYQRTIPSGAQWCNNYRNLTHALPAGASPPGRRLSIELRSGLKMPVLSVWVSDSFGQTAGRTNRNTLHQRP